MKEFIRKLRTISKEEVTMDLQKRLEKLRGLLEDFAFAVWLLEMETGEEAQAMLTENGLDFSIEEINDIRKDVFRCLETGHYDNADSSAIYGIATAIKATMGISGERTLRGRW